MTKYFKSQDPTLERSFRGHKDIITGLCFKPSLTQLASSSLDHSVMIWNFKPQLRAFRFVGHKAPVTFLDFAPTGQLLASSSRDKTIRLWTPNVKGDVVVFKAHTSSVRMVQFSHDGEYLVTCSDDKSIKIWSTYRTKFQYTLSGHMNWVRACKYSPDSRLLVSGSDDKTVKLWDLRSKTCIKTYWDHSGIVTSVDFHPHGTMIASSSMDRSIKLFDIRTHKLVQHYGDAHGSSPGQHVEGNASALGGTNSVSFGGLNGEWLISTGMDGLVKIWDIHEGHLFYTLHGHKNGPTTAAVFSPQGDFFATGGSDSQVMVWKSNFDKIDAGLVQNGTKEGAKERPKSSGSNHFLGDSGRFAEALSDDDQPLELGLNPQHEPKMNPLVEPYQHRVQGKADMNNSTRVEPYEKSILEKAEMSSSIRVEPFSAAASAKQNGMQGPTQTDQISTALSQMVRQIDILTQTMSILESRLTVNENKMNEVSQKLDKFLQSSNSLGHSTRSEKSNASQKVVETPVAFDAPNEEHEFFAS